MIFPGDGGNPSSGSGLLPSQQSGYSDDSTITIPPSASPEFPPLVPIVKPITDPIPPPPVDPGKTKSPGRFNCGGLAWRNYEMMDQIAVLNALNKGKEISCTEECESPYTKFWYFLFYRDEGWRTRDGTYKPETQERSDWHVVSGSGVVPQKYGPGPMYDEDPAQFGTGTMIPTGLYGRYIRITLMMTKKCYCLCCFADEAGK